MLVPSLLKQKRDASKSCHSTTVTGRSRKDLKLERLVFQRHHSNHYPFAILLHKLLQSNHYKTATTNLTYIAISNDLTTLITLSIGNQLNETLYERKKWKEK